MSIEKKLLGTTSGGDAPNVADVFSTYLYTGNDGVLDVTNGIDLAGEGGMVWVKSRSGYSYPHILWSSETTGSLTSVNTDALNNAAFQPTFNSDGFSFPSTSWVSLNSSADDYASWTFRKAPRFFDVVTYTGDGTAGRTIAHSLGVAPGMIIIKRTDDVSQWRCYHTSLGATKGIDLNNTAVSYTYSGLWNSTTPTDSVFSLGTETEVNGDTREFVAYLFAHDPDGEDDDGMIACGTWNGNGAVIDLGWEPQYLLAKKSSAVGSWHIVDNMRGVVTGGSDVFLYADLRDAEASWDGITFTATGFEVSYGTGDWIYMAIRSPMMKEPEAGTEVFAIDTQDNTSPAFTSNFPVDMVLRYSTGGGVSRNGSRLTQGKYLNVSGTDAEASFVAYQFDYNTGWMPAQGSTEPNEYSWMFKRAKGFFDVVAYTGTGVARTVAHNLGVVPEMMWVKIRSVGATAFTVYHVDVGNNRGGHLNDTAAMDTVPETYWNNTTPTESVFSIGTPTDINAITHTYIAYLFATLDGISKVGSYTGNGSNQNIACGFSGGARFVLIKRTDATGDWYIWDTERGIVTGNDPHLSLNTTTAQVTTDDSIDPQSAGFTVNQVSATNINVSSATYIFLAIA